MYTYMQSLCMSNLRVHVRIQNVFFRLEKLFVVGKEDQKVIIGPQWRFAGMPMIAGLEVLIFRGSGPVLLKKPISNIFQWGGGVRTPAPPPSGSVHIVSKSEHVLATDGRMQWIVDRIFTGNAVHDLNA